MRLFLVPFFRVRDLIAVPGECGLTFTLFPELTGVPALSLASHVAFQGLTHSGTPTGPGLPYGGVFCIQPAHTFPSTLSPLWVIRNFQCYAPGVQVLDQGAMVKGKARPPLGFPQRPLLSLHVNETVQWLVSQKVSLS